MSTDAPHGTSVPPMDLPKLQRQVHAMITAAGGYWRPINAVARLLEELAELGEQLVSPDIPDPRDDGRQLSGEFGDLAIIGTCLANQFNMILTDDSPASQCAGRGPASFIRLVQDAGRIARVVNYYDGPKNPRSFAGFPTLTAAIATFLTSLRELAAARGVDLDAAVQAKAAAAARDRGRFAVSYDPSTADSLRAYAAMARQPAHRLVSPGARLWGAPVWDGHLPVEHNIDRIIPFLTCFAKAAGPEHLDGFVILLPDNPETGDLAALSRHVARLLTGLAARDPQPDLWSADDVPVPRSRLRFRGIWLSVSVFSPLVPAPAAHYGGPGTLVLLQPEASLGSARAVG